MGSVHDPGNRSSRHDRAGGVLAGTATGYDPGSGPADSVASTPLDLDLHQHRDEHEPARLHPHVGMGPLHCVYPDVGQQLAARPVAGLASD